MTTLPQREVPTGESPAVEPRTDRTAVRQAQRSRFGKVRWGSAFFGWLATMGTAVLLGGLAVLVAAVSGYSVAPEVLGRSVDQVATTGVAPAGELLRVVVALAVLFVAYYCGGYVAGRMARFGGAKQGIAVWLWSVVGSAVVSVVALTAGDRLGAFRLVVDPAVWTLAGVVAAVIALVVALVGAALGGLGGMVYHRRVDRVTPEL
jgi:hypothetical protein